MHVFTSSLSLGHEGLVSHPPSWPLGNHQAKQGTKGRVAKSAIKRHMVKMVFYTCTVWV